MNFLFLDTFHPVLGSTHILAPCSGHSCLLGLSVSVYSAAQAMFILLAKGSPCCVNYLKARSFYVEL